MTNTNALVGWECPQCGNTDAFDVQVTGWARLIDNGVEDVTDPEWSHDSRAQCTDCDYEGSVSDFTGGTE